MVNKLGLALEQRQVSVDETNDKLIKELRTYEYVRNRTTGDYSFQGPGGKNDNLVAAALMAYEGFDRGWCGSARKYAGSII
jgi:hypothetical protein